jgi:hypothetical protein
MFSHRVFVLSALLIAAIPASLQAGLLIDEGFAYSAGSLAGDNGGTGWSDAWSASSSGSATVAAPGLTYVDGRWSLVTRGGKASLPGSHYGDFRTPTSVPTSGTMYLSFLADRPSFGDPPNYLGVSLFSGDTEQMIIGAGNSEPEVNHWFIEQNTTGNTYTASEAPGATPTLLVARIDFGASTDAVSLYVNPSLTAEPGTPSASATFNAFSWDRVRIQSGVAGDIDEIRIGTTYADVVPSIPEPNVVILLVTGLIGIMAYAWRRRK